MKVGESFTADDSMVLQRSTVVVGKDPPALARNLTADNDNALKAYVHFSGRGGSMNHSVSS
jgi:hypothetical protein